MKSYILIKQDNFYYFKFWSYKMKFEYLSIWLKTTTLIVLPLFLTSCATVQSIDGIGTELEASANTYTKNKDSAGTILLDVKWARQWSCGKFENAQLVSFAFDRLPLTYHSNDTKPDILIETTKTLAASPKFANLAITVPPGEYALSQFKIRISSSSSNIDYWIANRSDLIKNSKPYAGSFKVSAGETVYIGNFALDCFGQPMLWRYFTKGEKDFKEHLVEYQNKYPFLDLSKTKYRLFETDVIGRHYDLQ
jgi:hypothetical protein